MNYENKKIKFGFVRVLNNCILKHENFFTGKVKILSPGLKFVFGTIENRTIEINNNQFNNLCIDNINKEQFSFDVSISYQIAGGNSYNSKECKDYYRFLETCYLEEKNNEKEDWLGKYNNMNMYHGESFFKLSFNEFRRKKLRKWWHENHPILQYDKYKTLIIDDEKNILKNDIQSSLRDAFYDVSSSELSNLSQNSFVYKNLFYSIKKKIMEKGLNIIALNINNIKVLNNNVTTTNNNSYNFHLVDFADKKKKEEFIVDYVPLDDNKNVKKEQKNVLEEFVVDYEPLDKDLEAEKINEDDVIESKTEEIGFIVDYAPLDKDLEVEKTNEDDVIESKEEKETGFIVDYAPLDDNKNVKKEQKNVLEEFIVDYVPLDEDIKIEKIDEENIDFKEEEVEESESTNKNIELEEIDDSKLNVEETIENDNLNNQNSIDDDKEQIEYVNELYNKYFENYNNDNINHENTNSFVVSCDMNSELDKSLFEQEYNFNEIDESIAEIYIDGDGKFNDVNNIEPIEEDFDVDMLIDNNEDEFMTEEFCEKLDNDFAIGYLKIENQIIEVKQILNKEFKIDIPSFVNNNHEKVKVLVK